MALSGSKGSLDLGRRQPDPVILPGNSLQAGNDRFVVETDDYWPMDPVTLIHSGGSVSGYYHRNELDRARIHSTEAGALNGTDATVVDLNSVSGTTILAHSPSAAQIDILETLLPLLPDPVPQEQRLRSYPAQQAAFQAEAPALVMRLQATLTLWRFSVNGPQIDTTALGERFGDAIKSTVSGSGTCDFVIDLYDEANKQDSDPLLRSVLLTEIGSSARAQFVLRPEGEDDPITCVQSGITKLNRKLWYETDILFTNTEVDVSTANYVAGSASFITTGRIVLRT